MQRAIEFGSQRFEAFGVDRAPLGVPRPVKLTHGVEGEAHPCDLVRLSLATVGFLHDLSVYADSHRALGSVTQLREIGSRNAARRPIARDPLMNDLGNFRGLA